MEGHYGDGSMESWENCWYWSVREGEMQPRPLVEGTYHARYRFRVKLGELERGRLDGVLSRVHTRGIKDRETYEIDGV